jgi:hypothetical protein
VKAFPRGYTQEGMDLRDYFAAVALQALIAGERTDSQREGRQNYFSKIAYQYADAMMTVRKKED